MILTGSEIQKEVENRNIYIENFVREKVNPNSYNLTLNEKLLVYTLDQYCIDNDQEVNNEPIYYLDSAKPNETKELIIPEEGLVLMPGVLYLGTTNERTFTEKYAPMLEGRSSTGRLGMAIHITAGFGDVGFDGRWTLEITVQHPLKIYPNMEICQISYLPLQGDNKHKYNGKYQHQTDVKASHMFEDFNK